MPLTRPCLKSFITHQIKNNAGLQFVREPVTALEREKEQSRQNRKTKSKHEINPVFDCLGGKFYESRLAATALAVFRAWRLAPSSSAAAAGRRAKVNYSGPKGSAIIFSETGFQFQSTT